MPRLRALKPAGHTEVGKRTFLVGYFKRNEAVTQKNNEVKFKMQTITEKRGIKAFTEL